MKCGAIMHDEDASKHVCREADKPTKGKEKIPTTTDVSK